MKKDNNSEDYTLDQILIRTHYMTVLTDPSDKDMEHPIEYGSGFLLNYKEHLFFVTADHIVHPDDHDINQRTGKDFVVSIVNNVSKQDQPFSTLVTPLGGFYYADSLDFRKVEEPPKLLDVAVCLMKPKHCENPFLTHRMQDPNGNEIEQVKKLILDETHLAEPDKNDNYFVCGQVRHKLKGTALRRDFVLREGIIFQSQPSDYFLFKTPEEIVYEDWAGLSGSALFNQKGQCVGVLCSVNENTTSIWALGMDKVKMLCDIAILKLPQESQK